MIFLICCETACLAPDACEAPVRYYQNNCYLCRAQRHRMFMAKKIKSPYKQRLKYRETYNTTLRRVYEYSTTKYRRRRATQFVDGGQAYTYGSFKDAVERLSQRMSRYGISAGDKVAVLSQNMPNYLVAYFSVTAFGRVLVPILPDSSEKN